MFSKAQITIKVNNNPIATPTPKPTATPIPTVKSKVTLFEHADYAGVNPSFGVGEYNLNALSANGFGNDMASSIKVPAELKVTLYEHDGFCGRTIIRTSNDPTLVNDGFNDSLSSMKVERLP
jgi:hypothetical protein